MKRKSINTLSSFVALLSIIVVMASCVHQPIAPTGNGNGNNNGTDTTGTGNNDTTIIFDLCDPDTVYFENEIRPILNTYCGVSGCHDPATAQEEVVLTDYKSIITTTDVRPGRPLDSEIYERMVEDDTSERMPPPSSGITLSQDQVNKVYQWINQGAKNNSCDPNAGLCNTDNMSYQDDIAPIISNNCLGCHSGTSPQGNVKLDTYNGVVAVVNSGQLEGAITRAPGYTPMPYNQDKLDQCTIDKIKSWIDDGAPNN